MDDSFSTLLLTAFALVFVIEGLLYALFPEALRKMMALALSIPLQNLRFFGFTMALTGAFIAWLISKL